MHLSVMPLDQASFDPDIYRSRTTRWPSDQSEAWQAALFCTRLDGRSYLTSRSWGVACFRSFLCEETRREINALHKNSKKRKQEMNHADKNDDEDSYFNEFNDIDLSNMSILTK